MHMVLTRRFGAAGLPGSGKPGVAGKWVNWKWLPGVFSHHGIQSVGPQQQIFGRKT